MSILITWWEKSKNDVHGKNCHEQRKHCYMLVLSIVGMFGEEAQVLLKKVSQLMAKKPEELVSHVQGGSTKKL